MLGLKKLDDTMIEVLRCVGHQDPPPEPGIIAVCAGVMGGMYVRGCHYTIYVQSAYLRK